MKKILALSFLLSVFQSRAQLPDGSTAPDFTYTDIDGNEHHLYDYLNAGITVYIDIFAAHCPTCWNYHSQHQMKALYDLHGPAGTLTQDVMVLAIEHDPNNDTLEIYGISGNTQGNWDDGYPIINPEGADRVQFITDYNAVYYPMFYAICPNGIITLMTSINEPALYSHVALCPTIGINDPVMEQPSVYYNGNGWLIYKGLKSTGTIEITDLSGKLVFSAPLEDKNGQLPLPLASGMFIYAIRTECQTITGKFIF